MGRRVAFVEDGGAAHVAGIKAGDELLSIGGAVVRDVLDYRLLISESVLNAQFVRGGRLLDVVIEKDEEADLGLVFETGLMDNPRGCANSCLFCFVAQNPPGMRDTLYFRDDDWRLSFLTGNYITMTNMARADFARLRRYHLSPMNISVQAVSPGVRKKLLRNGRAGALMRQLRALRRSGISMNFQIVLCKGINDGRELERSVKKLAALWPQAASLSVVPAGTTKYRDGLWPLEPFGREDALAVVAQVKSLADFCRGRYGTAFVWAADEFYVKAGLEVPGYDEYEGFPQLDNGVGMLANFSAEFDKELERTPEQSKGQVCQRPRYVVTGRAAASFIEGLCGRIRERFGLKLEIIVVQNNFFGENVTVSGLLTGGDILRSAGRVESGSLLFIPRNALRAEGDLFLDGMTCKDLESALDAVVRVVAVSGADFVCDLIKSDF